MRFSILIIPYLHITNGLKNGVARTPPMGFISWQRFENDVDCTHHPKTCISEDLYRDIAQAMKDSGLVEAGYVYVNIDDNWSERDSNRVADHTRFRHGMKSLSKSIHKLGMKFGMYSDIGTKTCQQYPGLSMDDITKRKSVIAFIDQLIDWRVEYLKVDGCFAKIQNFKTTYPALSELIMKRLAVKNRDRPKGVDKYKPILLSCSWPAYEGDHGVNEEDLALLQQHCNTWRNYGDIKDSWATARSIVDWYASQSMGPDSELVKAAGPGHWNDPDMLLIGNNGLSIEQEKTQFNLWAIMAAPLYISADVRTMRKESLDILKNKKVIDINQDPLGRQGWVIDVKPEGELEPKEIRVWMRPLMPKDGHDRVAVLFESLREEGNVKDYSFDLKLIGWKNFKSWFAVDCYSETDMHVCRGSSVEEKMKSDQSVVDCSGSFFSVRIDENTSQMYVFTNMTFKRHHYLWRVLDLAYRPTNPN